MILFWFRKFLVWVVWLFVPPKPSEYLRIRASFPCPVCGNRENSKLRTREVVNQANEAFVVCQHTCGECGARFFEAPIVKPKPGMIWPAVARDELEKSEDQIQSRDRQAAVEERRGTGWN